MDKSKVLFSLQSSQVKVMSNPTLRFFSVITEKIQDQKRYTLGRILTIIDACISDKEQRKGIKNLIEEAYWSRWEMDDIKEIFRQFFEKYAKDLIPKDEGDINFWNDKGIEKSSTASDCRDYFSEN